MRIRSIQIRRWRNFDDIRLDLDEDTSLVCVVGANGTGKSHLMELLAAIAHQLGLAPGIETARGNPFSEPHDIQLIFTVAQGVSEAVESAVRNHPGGDDWDRSLVLESTRGEERHESRVLAGGILPEPEAQSFAGSIVQGLRQSEEVHLLALDADRAYPKKQLHPNQMAEAFGIDWSSMQFTRDRAYRASSTLYDEWKKYFLAQENQSGAELIQSIRRARADDRPEPGFEDHFDPYADALSEVLPHLRFTGVDTMQRTLLFDTTGLELTFDQLSGGEREIAFLIGQIDRFGLRQGLFLLDEPELHLNADLIRTWVTYLSGTVEQGQVWLATHSLEAVEAAGQHATFVLERDDETRRVNSVARLDERPALSALSRAVGSPAFSLSSLRFVYVEGEEGIGERERFQRLAGDDPGLRFLECGSCEEVVRRVSGTRSLAGEAEGQLRIGGVVDRDFGIGNQQREYEDLGILVLGVHEVENLFLHPPTLEVLLRQNGLEDLDPTDLILQAADARAGSWVFQFAMTALSDLGSVATPAKDLCKGLDWTDLEQNGEQIQQVVDGSGLDPEDSEKLRRRIDVAVQAYRRKRGEDRLWASCEGKQVLSDVAIKCEFSGVPTLVQAAAVAWREDLVQVPAEVESLREYLRAL